jgi:hypothetical protein
MRSYGAGPTHGHESQGLDKTENAMNIDIEKLSKRLAADTPISDYDFWRASKTINQVLYMIERYGLPVPIDVLRARKIVRQARNKRTLSLRGK